MKRRFVLGAACGVAFGLSGMARAQEVTELRFAVQTPPQVHYNAQLFAPWAEKVTAESEGTLKVTMFFAGTLGKEGQLVDLVQSGAADIALDLPAYYPGRFPLADVASLPLLITDATSGSEALWSLYEDGTFGSTFDGLKVLAISTPPSAMFLTTDKTVAVPGDMNGLKIAGGGKIRGDTLRAVGAAPVDVKVAELYQSLDRGVVDGAVAFYTAMAPFKLHEVGKHYLDVPLGGSLMLVFMDQARFDALPEAGRKAIDANSGAAMSAAFGGVWDAADEAGRGMARSAGGEIVEPDDAQTEAWTAALSPVVKDWASSVEGGPALIDGLKSKLGN